MIFPQQIGVSSTNPPNPITVTPPAKFASIKAVRIGNYSPFTVLLDGVHNDTGTRIILPAFMQNVFTVDNVRGPITATYQPLNFGTVIPANMALLVEFSDIGTDILGTYPCPLNGGAIVSATGPISTAALPVLTSSAANWGVTYNLIGQTDTTLINQAATGKDTIIYTLSCSLTPVGSTAHGVYFYSVVNFPGDPINNRHIPIWLAYLQPGNTEVINFGDGGFNIGRESQLWVTSTGGGTGGIDVFSYNQYR